MKKVWLMILASVFLSACGAGGILPAGTTSSAAPEVKAKAGETVAYVQGQDGLNEGVVESVEGTRYKLKYGTSSGTHEESDIYALPKPGAKLSVKAGDMVAAKVNNGTFWASAEVLSVKGDVIEVKGLYYGNTASLSPDKIIVPRPAAAAEFQKYKAQKDFEKKAKTGKPRVPANYTPKAGDHVVAEWTTNAWWQGEIESVTGGKAKIKWDSFPASDIALDKVMPYPKPETGGALPAADSYVLVKTASDPRRWDYAQVTAASGNSGEVKFADGKTQEVKAGDFMPIS